MAKEEREAKEERSDGKIALADFPRFGRSAGRLVYARRDHSVWEEEHRRALTEVLKEDRRVAQLEEPSEPRSSSGDEFFSVPVPVPAVTFLSDDGEVVARLPASRDGASVRAVLSSAAVPSSPSRQRRGTTSRQGKAARRPRSCVSAGAAECPEASQGPLAFSAAFESGNLLSAKLVSIEDGDGSTLPRLEYELHLDNDTQAEREHTQWFYFAVYNSVPCSVTFRVANFRKRGSLHRNGMQPFVRAMSSGFSEWDATCCKDISYLTNFRSGGSQYYTLTFRYEFRSARDVVFFAHQTPYTLSMLRTTLAKLGSNGSMRRHFSEQQLCKSLGGLEVPLLMVSSGLPEMCMGRGRPNERIARRRHLAETFRKPAIVVIARQHPGETCGSYVVLGLLRFLLGESSDARALRQRFCFHIVPMLNVDGVVHGNSRCTLAGHDPNRCWLSADRELHPEVFHLREHAARLQQAGGVHLFLDLHGHSQRFGSFFYGNCPEQIRSALYPKLASLGTQDVDFSGSRWRFAKAHNKAARAVMFNHFGIFNSYTVETSFFAQKMPEAPLAGNSRPSSLSGSGSGEAWMSRLREVLFTPRRSETIGRALGWAMRTFFGLESPAVDQAAELQELRASPWLTYAQLRSTTAAEVLAGLEALGRTVFDLQGRRPGSDAEMSADSDGGPEEDDRASPEPPAERPCQEVAVPRLQLRQFQLNRQPRPNPTSFDMSRVVVELDAGQGSLRTCSGSLTHSLFESPSISPKLSAKSSRSHLLSVVEGGVSAEWLASAQQAKLSSSASAREAEAIAIAIASPSEEEKPEEKPIERGWTRTSATTRGAGRPTTRKARISNGGPWRSLMELAAENNIPVTLAPHPSSPPESPRNEAAKDVVAPQRHKSAHISRRPRDRAAAGHSLNAEVARSLGALPRIDLRNNSA